MLDIRGYKLQRKFGLTVEQALGLLAADMTNPAQVRRASQKALRDAGLPLAKIKAIKGKRARE